MKLICPKIGNSFTVKFAIKSAKELLITATFVRITQVLVTHTTALEMLSFLHNRFHHGLWQKKLADGLRPCQCRPMTNLILGMKPH